MFLCRAVHGRDRIVVKRAVADQADHRPFRIGRFHSQRGRKAGAQTADAAGKIGSRLHPVEVAVHRQAMGNGFFHDHRVERYLNGGLDTATASMAKYWITDVQGKIIDRCLQLFGGYGYMEEYPISRLYRDARVMRIYAGSNEIMKVIIARSL